MQSGNVVLVRVSSTVSELADLCENYQNRKHAQVMHKKLIFACVKHGRVLNSLFGEALKHIVQKQARHAHQRMTCGYGAIWGVHNCVSGEHSEDILIFIIFVESEYDTFSVVKMQRACCGITKALCL